MENDEITPKSSEKVSCECGYYLSKEPWKRRLFSGMSCYRILECKLIFRIMIIMDSVMNYIINHVFSILIRIENDIGPDFAVSMQ